MRQIVAVLAFLLAHPVLAQFDTPLIPASGGYTDGIEDVDISGQIAVVATRGSSAPADTVYVFRRIGSGWLPDTAFVPEGGQLNRSLAVHGTRLIVGDTRADFFGNNAGAAFVFDYMDGVWAQTATLVGSDTDEFDQFGSAVDLTDSLAVVGAASGHPSGVDGAVYVFRLQNDGTYEQEAKLFPDQAFFDGSFGEELAASGERVLSGQPTGKPGFPEAAFFYTRTGSPTDPNGGWVLEDSVAAPPSQPDISFGGSVALDGYFALITSGPGTRVYRHQTGQWIEDGVLGIKHQSSVDLSGLMAMIGDEDSNIAAEGAGSLHLFSRDQIGEWHPMTTLTATDAQPNDYLGGETAMDGLQVITSGNRKAWVFDISTLVSAERFDLPIDQNLVVSPNPARTQATLRFSLPLSTHVRISIVDVTGREVVLIENGVRARGVHHVDLPIDSLAPGVYLARIASTAQIRSGLFTVVR